MPVSDRVLISLHASGEGGGSWYCMRREAQQRTLKVNLKKKKTNLQKSQALNKNWSVPCVLGKPLIHLPKDHIGALDLPKQGESVGVADRERLQQS